VVHLRCGHAAGLIAAENPHEIVRNGNVIEMVSLALCFPPIAGIALPIVPRFYEGFIQAGEIRRKSR
jgi:hypothetical protein